MLEEIEVVLDMLDQLHTEILEIVEDVGSQGMNWSPGSDFNSIYAIATHTAASQLWWIKENLAGEVIDRDRPAEFAARGVDLESLKAGFEDVQAISRGHLANITSEDMRSLREVSGRSMSVRWILLHVLDHTATHLGHMHITMQLYKKQEQSE
jgi:uncharacterized damage-inducible protein DinB